MRGFQFTLLLLALPAVVARRGAPMPPQGKVKVYGPCWGVNSVLTEQETEKKVKQVSLVKKPGKLRFVPLIQSLAFA